MDRAQLQRMESRIERLSEPARSKLKERLRTLLEDDLRLTSDVKTTFIQQHGPAVWNSTCYTIDSDRCPSGS